MLKITQIYPGRREKNFRYECWGRKECRSASREVKSVKTKRQKQACKRKNIHAQNDPTTTIVGSKKARS